MSCYRPLKGFKKPEGGIGWSPAGSYQDLPISVPCGQCVGCRLERARQWSVRMMHECSLHDDNCFLTLTYSDEKCPKDGSLRKSDMQKFWKRLRRRLEPLRISYFYCGEYGDVNGRPHYHAIVFGFKPPDLLKKGLNGQGDPLFKSSFLEELWSFGFVTVGNVTFETCGYVARYCLKKVTGDIAEDHYKRVTPDGEIYWIVPEFANMSVRPAIGKEWFAKFGDDVRNYDGVVQSGRLGGSPKYYDKLRGRVQMRPVKRKRVFKALEHADNNTPERLAVREEVKRASISLLKRSV